MMKNLKKWITSPAATVALFALAAGLLLFSTIGAARAALTIFSETYSGHVEMYDIGVTLLERSPYSKENKAQPVAYRDFQSDAKKTEDLWKETPGGVGTLLKDLLGNEKLVPGKTYLEELSVQNTGTINEWVRVTIYKYWTRDPEYNRQYTSSDEAPATPDLSPDLIQLGYTNLDKGDGSGDWILDDSDQTPTSERAVFYYNKLLHAGDTTPILTDTIRVDDYVASKVSQSTRKEGEYTIITTSYDYDGWQFCIEAVVDAVQEHNAVDAIKSAWGRDVSIRSNGTLKLN